jgi:predicted transglutaminase-like cysteine proteinase
MYKYNAIRLAFCGAILGLVLTGPAAAVEATQAEAPRDAYMATTGRTAQPIGHFEFCREHAAECSVRSLTRARVALTPALWNQLVSVNASVNLAITPATDEEVYGRPEVWAYPVSRGDCEDLVLLKRRTLIEKGWPVGALLITVVRQQNGDGHAVLTVLTDRGDLILDNLQPRVLVWTETDYEYVKRQSELHSGQWMQIDDAPMTAVGSLTR